MKFFCAIASLLFLMSFNAFAQIPSDKDLRINLSGTKFSGIISNTQPDIQYEIQRKQDENKLDFNGLYSWFRNDELDGV